MRSKGFSSPESTRMVPSGDEVFPEALRARLAMKSQLRRIDERQALPSQSPARKIVHDNELRACWAEPHCN